MHIARDGLLNRTRPTLRFRFLLNFLYHLPWLSKSHLPCWYGGPSLGGGRKERKKKSFPPKKKGRPRETKGNFSKAKPENSQSTDSRAYKASNHRPSLSLVAKLRCPALPHLQPACTGPRDTGPGRFCQHRNGSEKT